jgi:hypothetical protein
MKNRVPLKRNTGEAHETSCIPGDRNKKLRLITETRRSRIISESEKSSVVLHTFFLDELDEQLEVRWIDVRQNTVTEVENMA